MKLQSVEGWNFDALGDLVGRYGQIMESKLYISEYFTRGNLHMQVIKHEAGRVVGLLVREQKLIIELGCWSSNVSYNLYTFAKREGYCVISVGFMSQEAIDILQDGFVVPTCEI